MKQNYIGATREQEEYIGKFIEENSELTGLNTILYNDINTLKENMEKLENDLGDLNVLRKNMMTSIEILPEENCMLKKEVDDKSAKQHRDEVAVNIETRSRKSNKHPKSLTPTECTSNYNKSDKSIVDKKKTVSKY
ncbi:unnamed protein product [Ceutorhynchus assimilis]|uniref:Uncharacterized protein n=1 Tax=Ceutorhynchus assimilis TaxID=467358 RepID=A0A9N9MF76_9CUCU|nr:unnamed protein product [Ceutorhynchus assimilis]